MISFGSPTFGLEEVATEALLVLKENLNDQIAIINAKYATEDLRIGVALGRTIPPAVLEEVEIKNMDVGQPDDLVESMADMTGRFPSVNVIASTSRDSGRGGDTYTQFSVTLNIECWVKAEPDEGSTVAYKRASRIIEAAHAAINKNPTLNGIILNFGKSPQAAISPVITKELIVPNVNLDNSMFDKQEDHFNGWYLCGGGIIYDIQKNSSI